MAPSSWRNQLKDPTSKCHMMVCCCFYLKHKPPLFFKTQTRYLLTKREQMYFSFVPLLFFVNIFKAMFEPLYTNIYFYENKHHVFNHFSIPTDWPILSVPLMFIKCMTDKCMHNWKPAFFSPAYNSLRKNCLLPFVSIAKKWSFLSSVTNERIHGKVLYEIIQM